MEHGYTWISRKLRLALAAAGAISALGIGTVQAQDFASADISIEPRGEEAGGLNCSWRETRVGASMVVYYECNAGAVGALYACTYKNRVIYNSPTKLDTFTDVSGEHGAVPFLSQKNGQIKGSTITPVPEVEEPEGEELCTAPSEQTLVAVRWCDTSLTDVTYNVQGAAVGELFEEFVSGVGSVPSCAELMESP